MPPVEFEPTISAGERPQTYALDRAATVTGKDWLVSDTFTTEFRNCLVSDPVVNLTSVLYIYYILLILHILY